MMVGEGWALAYRDFSEKYVPQENVAREARKGIWAMQFAPPWEWREYDISGNSVCESSLLVAVFNSACVPTALPTGETV